MVRGSTSTGPLRALLAVDGSEASLHAVRRFASRFRLDGASVRVVQVLELPPSTSVPPAWQKRADEALSAARSLLEPAGVRPESVIARGTSTAGILNEAEDFGASLVVVGAQGLGRPLHLPSLPAFRGTVAKRVARHATCSVFLAAPPLGASPMKHESEET
jgi:nucleotide-binding universal stress UspA family protein